MENKDLIITTNEGREVYVIDSREVAEMMGKTHGALLKDLQGSKDGKSIGIIPTLEKSNLDLSNYFIESSYKDAKGRERKCYLVTKMGCELLGSKQQGVKGIIFNTLFNDRLKDIECDTIKHDVKLVCETLKETHKRSEIEFLNMLEQALEPFNIQGIRQY